MDYCVWGLLLWEAGAESTAPPARTCSNAAYRESPAHTCAQPLASIHLSQGSNSCPKRVLCSQGLRVSSHFDGCEADQGIFGPTLTPAHASRALSGALLCGDVPKSSALVRVGSISQKNRDRKMDRIEK